MDCKTLLSFGNVRLDVKFKLELEVRLYNIKTQFSKTAAHILMKRSADVAIIVYNS